MAAKKPSRTPDFVVKAMQRETDRSQRIGAAWMNDNGSVSIDLDPFVVLEGKDRPIVTLFPWDEK